MKSIIAAIVILFIHGCTLFEKDESLLAEHTKSNGEKIKIYYGREIHYIIKNI